MNAEGKGFQFKRFFVRHEKSTMKVGTDAVLLGAWAEPSETSLEPSGTSLEPSGTSLEPSGTSLEPSGTPSNPSNPSNILDLGCGCGVISIMLAQRYTGARVVGIDIDEASVQEADRNAKDSPFADRLGFHRMDVTALPPEFPKFDLIVSNPPFYQEDTLPPDERRARARNARHLAPEALVKAALEHLTDKGTLALVLPLQSRDSYVDAAIACGLYPNRECLVRTTPRKDPKRVLLQFSRERNYTKESLTLMNADGTRSAEYTNLCQEFYL